MALLSLLLVTILSPVNRKKWITGTLSGAMAAALITVFAYSTDSNGELQRSLSQRARTLVLQGENSESLDNANERVRIWRKTLELIKDKPITGAGPANWKLAIPSYGTDNLVWSTGKYAPDRPHNVYLQVAADTGIPGALLYVGFWILVMVAGVKVLIQSRSEDQRILTVLMLSGLAGFASDGMFSFPTERIEHTLYILLMGGIILGTYYSIARPERITAPPLKKSALVLLFLALFFNLFIGLKKYGFEQKLGRVKAFENLKRFQEMADEAKSGKNLYVTLGGDVGISMELKRAIALKELKQYEQALKEINIAKRYHPNSAAVWNTEGTIYTDLKQYEKAIFSYQQAAKITPQYDIVLKNLGMNYFLLNNYDACISELEKIKDLQSDPYFSALLAEAKKRRGTEKPL
jgi:tetratricopeptide (TPR) repeat protein